MLVGFKKIFDADPKMECMKCIKYTLYSSAY